MLIEDPETGLLSLAGKPVGSVEVSAGKAKVRLNLSVEISSEDYPVFLAWLAYGAHLAKVEPSVEVALEVRNADDDVEEITPSGPICLLEKTIRVDGYKWRFHKSDADPWPSGAHGHDYERGLVIDAVTGEIFDQFTRTKVKQLKRKHLLELQTQIRTCEDLRVQASLLPRAR